MCEILTFLIQLPILGKVMNDSAADCYLNQGGIIFMTIYLTVCMLVCGTTTGWNFMIKSQKMSICLT